MNHKDILKKHMWWRVDVDKAYWYQCVDWIRMYSTYRGREIPNRWNAIDLWEKWLGKDWKKIPKSLLNYPSEGDVVVWDKTWWGWYGHIAICWKFCNPLVLRTVDQNAGSGSGDGLGKNSISPFFRGYKWVVWWFHYTK